MGGDGLGDLINQAGQEIWYGWGLDEAEVQRTRFKYLRVAVAQQKIKTRSS
jgi:hypothetical protein